MKTTLIKKEMTCFKTSVCLLLVSLLFSCSGNDPKSTSLPSKPEAIAAYDASSAGIVKGVLVGSSGVFKFSIKNGNDSVYCKMTFDGQTGMLLPTASFASWQPGQTIAANFTGTIGGVQVSVYFKCNANGSSPSAEFTIPNHTVSVSLYKETSTNLVKGYEGTYSSVTVSTGKEISKGTFNFILYNGVVAGTHSGTDGSGTFTATVAGGKMTFTNSDSTKDQTLDIDDVTVSGSMFTSSDNSEKTTVAGKRTL